MKATFNNMKLKVNTEVKTLTIREDMDPIEVKQYLPIKDKIDMIEAVIDQSKEGTIYNRAKIEMYFSVYLVFLYTNISFTENQKQDIEKIYDVLESNEIFDKVVDLIPDSEYSFLKDTITENISILEDHNNRAGAAIKALIEDLPRQAETFGNILDTFDKEKYAEVINFARAANGNRDIHTNQPIE